MAIIEVKIRWARLAGATGYEILKDGVVVGTRGKLATTTSVRVDDKTLIEVKALPNRELVSSVDLAQVTVTE